MSITTGVTSPGTVESRERPDSNPWVNPGNAKESDDNFAVISFIADSSSEWLAASNFGFALPNAARIIGIKSRIELLSAFELIPFDSVSLIIAGTIDETTNQVDGETTDTTEAVVTFGGVSDLWGLVLTRDMIESSGFGVAIAFPVPLGIEVIFVDHITIEVFYQLPGASEIFSAGESASDFFTSGVVESDTYAAGAVASRFFSKKE